MVNKLEKELAKLSKTELKQFDDLLDKLERGDHAGLDIKKLKGSDDIFRARKGKLRVIYQKRGDEIILVMVSRRSEKTYREF